ncbi:hypothetical protein C2S52_010458 [Perilla frutescens var. hirtella]|nr:hypothetical protein C2S52_010458 [Perilla frutescens var. hirtella]
MNPMPGPKLIDIDSFEKLMPPPLAKMTGRSRKKRMRNKGEKKKVMASGKLDRSGAIMSCGICKSSDHNRRTCPNNPSKSTVTWEPVTEIPNSSSQPPTTQETNCNSQDVPESSKKRKKFAAKRKSRRVHGYGVYINSNSGNITMDPGMRSEQRIKQRDPIASQAISTNPDPVIRFSIPNERELRKEILVDLRKNSGGARKIAFAADGSQSIIIKDLPFKPPGVQWKGKQAMKNGQLQRERDNMKKKIGN